jgi:hypothetical protein
MPTFIPTLRGTFINADHVARLVPLSRERGKPDGPRHYSARAWNDECLGVVSAVEVQKLLGRLPEQPDEEPNYELFVIGGRS